MAESGCPHCGAVREAGAAECAVCGLVFEKWNAAQTRREFSAAVDAREASLPQANPVIHRPKPTLPWIWLAVLLGVPPLIWLCIKAPAGLPVPEKSYHDPLYGFAVPIPEGWTAERVNETTESHTNVVRITGAGASIDVAFASRSLPRSAESTILINEIVKTVYKDRFNTYSLDEPREVVVDNLPAFKLRGQGYSSGAKLVVQKGVPAHEEAVSSAAGFLIALVKAADGIYVVSATADKSDYPNKESLFGDVVRGFRVVERPLSWSHLWRLLTHQLREEAVGIMFGWIFAFYKLVLQGFLD